MSDPGWPSWLTPPPTVDELITDDGEPMESERHQLQMNLLIESLRAGWADRHDFYVAGNMFLYFSTLQTKKNDFRGPDVFVVLGTERRERKAWVIWEEDGQHPDVIIELTSDSTRDVDHGAKMRTYARLAVADYFIFDPFTAKLEGYTLEASSVDYRPLAPAPSGRLPSARLGLEMGVAEGRFAGVECRWLRWFTPDGKILPTPEEQRDEAARQRDEALARLAAYEQKFGKLPEPG